MPSCLEHVLRVDSISLRQKQKGFFGTDYSQLCVSDSEVCQHQFACIGGERIHFCVCVRVEGDWEGLVFQCVWEMGGEACVCGYVFECVFYKFLKSITCATCVCACVCSALL